MIGLVDVGQAVAHPGDSASVMRTDPGAIPVGIDMSWTD